MGYQQVLEETVTNEVTSELIKRVVYTIDHDQIAQTTFTPSGPNEGETLVFHADGHGSTRVLTNLFAVTATFGGIRQIFHFDAYGNALGFNPAAALTSVLYSGIPSHIVNSPLSLIHSLPPRRKPPALPASGLQSPSQNDAVVLLRRSVGRWWRG